jgi:Fe-S oxidoreductase
MLWLWIKSTFCCGGGGGLLTDDLMEIRIKGAMPRMQALKEVEKTDAVNNITRVVESHCSIVISRFIKF